MTVSQDQRRRRRRLPHHLIFERTSWQFLHNVARRQSDQGTSKRAAMEPPLSQEVVGARGHPRPTPELPVVTRDKEGVDKITFGRRSFSARGGRRSYYSYHCYVYRVPYVCIYNYVIMSCWSIECNLNLALYRPYPLISLAVVPLQHSSVSCLQVCLRYIHNRQ